MFFSYVYAAICKNKNFVFMGKLEIPTVLFGIAHEVNI